MDKFSYLGNADTGAIEQLFNQYKNDPNSVDISWKKFFEGFEFAKANYEDGGAIPENVSKEFKVINLINEYRKTGHLFTETNPVRERRKYTPTLDVENFGLVAADLETEFQAGDFIGIGKAKLSVIVAHLKQTYCKSIGIEYMHIRRPDIIEWFQQKMETTKNKPNFNLDEKTEILTKLNQAVGFENFLHTKFVGQKRFSLEGAEAIIPALDTIIEYGADMGIEDFVLGMAHRGRLSVLANILNKAYKDIFTEFEGRPSEDALYEGDVKYHMGYSSDQVTFRGKKVHTSLTPNPSHLEAVNPVVVGITRAKADQKHAGNYQKVCPISIHGDAAVAGQGIIYEVLQMSMLDGYKVGGTIHLVINNQVGFTTNYTDARSSTYCTDIAKVVLAPIFHVNGDDAEAVVLACKMAVEYRQKYERDVFIDVLCYRKYGHNEGDEPRFTQPLLYKAIAAHPNPLEIYSKQLIDEGSITADAAKQLQQNFKNLLQEKLDEAKQTEKAKITSFLNGTWNGLRMAKSEDFEKSPATNISKNKFLELAKSTTTLPADKKFFNKTEKTFKDRKEMIASDKYDWAMGELLAYASLMDEGHWVRFSGQDVERGTFSHRHAVIKLEDSEEEYVPLNNISDKQGKFEIYNSLLSEYAVLGFEYGYAFAAPNSLTIWEAQFGDFFNGAQIIIDQFISSAEAKWRRMNGMVMLLPHGYEGQGPEHSSARMERFLQMCADYNWQIINATTPANQFHALRRQLKRDFRKPLLCFTPKKLLRYPSCVSSITDFTEGGFKEVLDDTLADVKNIKRVAFCTGKVYYDIIETREKEGVNDLAVIRIEQLYPFPATQINALVEKYKNAKEYLWVQEESENMGAYAFVMKKLLHLNLKYVGRNESASPATGFSKTHAAQHEMLMNKLFQKAAVTK
ncbi:MAG: 2-oxoglutarate dehydrogenase E1 component [Bacteroidota bacterium]